MAPHHPIVADYDDLDFLTEGTAQNYMEPRMHHNGIPISDMPVHNLSTTMERMWTKDHMGRYVLQLYRGLAPTMLCTIPLLGLNCSNMVNSTINTHDTIMLSVCPTDRTMTMNWLMACLLPYFEVKEPCLAKYDKAGHFLFEIGCSCIPRQGQDRYSAPVHYWFWNQPIFRYLADHEQFIDGGLYIVPRREGRMLNVPYTGEFLRDSWPLTLYGQTAFPHGVNPDNTPRYAVHGDMCKPQSDRMPIWRATAAFRAL